MRYSRKLFLFLLIIAQCAWCTERQPNAIYRARREKLAERTNGAAVLLFAPLEAEGPNDVYGFRQDNNFYYLTGWAEPGAALLVVPETKEKPDSPAHPYTEIFFLPQHSYVQEKWTGPKLGPENPDAHQITGFDKVEAIDSLRAELVRLLPTRVATIFTDVVTSDDASNSATSIDWLKRANAFPLVVSLNDVRPLLSSLRTTKDAGEIELIRKADNASMAAQLAAIRAIKPGMTEREISALLQYEWGKRGCERPAYAPIVGAGFDSTILHYSADDGPINAGDLVLMDAAGEYSMYAADITRTVPATGKFTARQREIYDIVLGAQNAAINAFQSGKSILKGSGPDSLYKVAYDYINTHGKDLHGQPLGQYFIHGLSHYIGLAVHDDGDYNVALGPGAAFTIEPGIYIPEEKIGVRIEDDFYVDPNGKLINLTGDLPRTADAIEHAMAGK
ncbi:MAG TPA: Xaa-Pro aminopeptidase [Terriglobales bacterium]|jgi:Xaa-Pro aminopeptidase